MWNVNDGNEEVEREELNEDYPVVNINGDQIEVEVGDNFVETIVEIARDHGVGKFKVVLNGHEIDAEDAPTEFKAGDVVTLVKFEDPA